MGSVARFLCAGLALTALLGALPQTDQALAAKRTVPGELERLLQAGAIDEDTYSEDRAAYDDAKRFTKRLSGRREIEMRGVLGLLERFARQGSLTASREPALFETLQRNRRYWSTGGLLAAGTRYSFPGSELIWQYFPGQGLQLHPLANFGKLNALWRAHDDERLELLLDELLAIAADRAGGVAWEYYFDFGGGRPPWVSGLAQGTALQALARAGIRLGRKEEVMAIARRGLGVFETDPPAGVRVSTDGGAHYLQYSFNSRLFVLNGFIQSLVGLYDYARYANDDVARQLFSDGDRAARAEVPRYDTGAWSLYSRVASTHESDLHYHELLTEFLNSLCKRTVEAVYCDAVSNFNAYLKLPPELVLVTERVRGNTTAPLKFELSKISRVGVHVSRAGKQVFGYSGLLGYGHRSVLWRVPKRSGSYDVTITAVDLAGNSNEVTETVEVLKPRKRRA